MIFLCSLKEGSEIKPGSNPDSWQVGVEWLELDKIDQNNFYPKALRNILSKGGLEDGPFYLGDVN